MLDLASTQVILIEISTHPNSRRSGCKHSKEVAMKAEKLISIEDQFGANNYHPLDIVIKKAEGVWVEDVAGNKYMDFLAAYSAVNQGHCHPRLLKALRRQAAKVTLTSRAFRNDQLPLFCQEVCELTGYEKVLPMNSGGEAVETAIKAARKWGEKIKGVKKNKAEIIVCADNFHGRTTTIVGFSTEEQYKDGFGPFTPGFKVIPFGDAKAGRSAGNKIPNGILHVIGEVTRQLSTILDDVGGVLIKQFVIPVGEPRRVGDPVDDERFCAHLRASEKLLHHDPLRW